MNRTIARMTVIATVLLATFMAIASWGLVSAQSADEDAIKDVITRFNSASEVATDSHDMSVERDLTTDSYFREMSADMQEGWAGGIVSVNMMRLEWGPVVVNGDTATATTFETWAIALDDGSTGQLPPSRNVYRLVREGGSWKVDADDHPDDGPSMPMI